MNEKLDPLVTIVTITLNLIKAEREKYFRQCLESVHNQTYKNIEHIVIDGASTDGTIDLIREYEDKGWIKYISEKDTGIYDAMNKGIRMAKGIYIAFLNSDDYYHGSGGVASSVRKLEESDSDFSFAPIFLGRARGAMIRSNNRLCSPKISDIFFVMPFCHQTMFSKKSVLIEVGMFDNNFKSAGDYDLAIRLCLKNYKSVFVSDIFTTFRFGGLSDLNQDQSKKEIAAIYFKNYSKLTPMTMEVCEKIYLNPDKIPIELARKLASLKKYFDFDEYIVYSRHRLINKLKRKIKSIFN
jgi:glycosyltransferase involved in cell wall biosynthesis